MRTQFLLAFQLVAAISFGQVKPVVLPPAPQFTADEKSKIIDYWSQPGRFQITTPADAIDKGLWQVRLTVRGSQWLMAYNKARKVSAPPTQNAQPANELQQGWESWVVAKLNRDRWDALVAAQDANERILGKRVPNPDKTIPSAEPPQPGPIPDALLALAGDPPKFAEATVPMEKDVTFDDVTLTYQDNVRVSNPRYTYYRFSQGVNSEGVAVKEMSTERLDHLFRLADVSESEAKIMRAVSILEGGFDAINTYDTGFVSVGFIQFACLREGAGSLGEMMIEYKNNNPDDFQRDLRQYGIDVQPNGLLDVLDPQTGAELFGPDAAQKIIEDARLIAVFQRAGLKSDSFIAAQIRSAKNQFFPNDTISVSVGNQTLTGRVSDIIKSEAGLATLMDRKVNTGHLDPLLSVVTDVARSSNIQDFSDLANHEMEIVQRMKYRKNYLDDSTLTQPVGDRLSRNVTNPSRKGKRGSRGGG